MTREFLLTVNGAAGLLGLSLSEVNRLVRQRRIPFIPLPGGEIRFSEADLTEWAESFKQAALPASAG